MNTRFLRQGALLSASILISLPAAAAKAVFSDVIVVTAQRGQSNTDTTYGDEAMSLAADTAVLVAQLPGAAVINNGSLSGQVQYRGAYGLRVGARLNGQTFRSGGPNLMDPPMHYAPATLVDTIKVNRGAAPVSFGPSLVGGVETQLKQVPFAELDVLEASYDVTAIGRSADSSHGIGLVGGVSNQMIRAYGFYSDERGSDREFPGGYIDSTSYDRQVYGLGAGLKHGNSEWDLELRRQETGPTGNPPFAMDIDYVKTDFARLRFETKFADTTMALAFGYSDVSHGMNNFGQRPPPPMTTRYRYTTASGTTHTVALDFSTPLGTGELEYGFDVETGEHDALISNPNNTAFFVSSIPDIEQDRFGAYVNWKGDVGLGNIELGARVDRYEDRSGKAVTGPALPAMVGMLAMTFNQSERDWNDTAVDLMARYWRQSELGAWRFSIARKNRAPMFLERYGWLPIAASAGLADGNNYVGDVALDLETAWLIEAGIDLRGTRWWLRPSIFYHDVNNYIQGVPFDATVGMIDDPVEMISMMNGDPSPLQFSNVEAKMYGVDADYGWQLAENWRIEGVLSIVRGERRDIDDDLYRISPDRLTMALVYEHTDWSVSLSGEAVRAQEKVSKTNNERETSGYGFLHLFTTWQVNDQLQLSGGVENLLDREYVQHLAGYNRVRGSDVVVGDRLPGTGRNLFLKISIQR